MKKFTIIIMLILIFSSGGYYFSKPKVSEEQAKNIVVKHHTRNMGKVTVTSISHRDNRYVIKWANKENCESGTDYINDKNGEIEKGQVSIC